MFLFSLEKRGACSGAPPNTEVDRLLQSGEALEGNQVPVDRRKFNGRQTADKMNSADSFFNHYYHQIVFGINCGNIFLEII